MRAMSGSLPSRNSLAEIVQKKKECNAKAQAVVEFLIERNINHYEFKEKLGNINQSHYEDVVDERNIQRLCGYPICSENLESIPNKKYHISLPKKKVYDMTERNKFCSMECYVASKYIKAQISTSPLWLRSQDTSPKFKLLK